MDKLSLDLQIERTADGSDTLYIPSLDEHYHSVNGAVQESQHVFINAGLREISAHKNHISILEIGFGTGLNAILTYSEALAINITIDYTTLELFPLPNSVVAQLNVDKNLPQKKVLIKMHDTEWNTLVKIDNNFALFKKECDFTELDFNPEGKTFDLIYFDAFAPDKQSEMWSENIFDYLYKHTNIGGILTTYCAKGSVRRMMQNAGYIVERLAGPPGKREMLRATRK